MDNGMMVSAVSNSGVACTQCSGSLLKLLGRLGIGTIPGCKKLVLCPIRASIAVTMDGQGLMMVFMSCHGRRDEDASYRILSRKQ